VDYLARVEHVIPGLNVSYEHLTMNTLVVGADCDAMCVCLHAQSSGATPLWIAAARGHLETLMELQARGADINATGGKGVGRPLFYESHGLVFLKLVRVLVSGRRDAHRAHN
jgi:hypothetical protein